MKEFFKISKLTLFIFIIVLVLVGLTGIYKKPTSEVAPDKQVVQELPPGTREPAKVQRIIDGDTFVIGNDVRVRILGIDAEEKDSPCYDAAKSRLEDAIDGQEVILESGSKDKDVYGRLLRYVFVGEENISETLVKEGLVAAEAPYEGGKYDAEIAALENYARLNKIGCKWAE